MEESLTKALKQIIKSEIGDMVHDEIKLQFQPIQKALDTIIDENRKYHDNVSRQITEDRKDINQLTVDTSTGIAQNKIIIKSQNTQGEELANIVKEEAQKIPKHIENMFEKKPFLTKIRNKFTGR